MKHLKASQWADTADGQRICCPRCGRELSQKVPPERGKVESILFTHLSRVCGYHTNNGVLCEGYGEIPMKGGNM